MPRRSFDRRRLLTMVGAALPVALVAACTRGKGSGGTGGGRLTAVPPAVTITPTDGAAKVTPVDPVLVKAEHGRLTSVSLTNAAGKQVKGTLSADGLTWTPAEKLGYGKTYSLTATVTNTEGKKTSATSSFTTVKPGNYTMAYIQNSARTYGVGEPVRVHFDEEIGDKAAAEKALHVTTTPHVDGCWHWLNSQDVHWRPKTDPGEYWPSGTRVTVSTDIYGVNMGKDLWGQQDTSLTFHIGDKHVAVGTNKSLHLKVYENDKLVRNVPFSGGKGGYITDKYGDKISLWTPSGTMVIIEQAENVHMTSSSWGISKSNPEAYDVWVKWGSRLTYDGIFLHAAPWNESLHGVQNDSHGCFNLSTTDAKWFYDNFQPGDIVILSGTPDKVTIDRGYGDWNVSWDEWVKGSALKQD
jgi:lipoprotein-anchoring transpeptidase ErfK/SrfK